MKYFAIDFDGVIHRYSKGWADGSIYDELDPSFCEAIELLFANDFAPVIFTVRKPVQIQKHLRNYCANIKFKAVDMLPITFRYDRIVYITMRKPPAQVYIDDRAVLASGDLLSDVKYSMKRIAASTVEGERKVFYFTLKLPNGKYEKHSLAAADIEIALAKIRPIVIEKDGEIISVTTEDE